MRIFRILLICVIVVAGGSWLLRTLRTSLQGGNPDTLHIVRVDGSGEATRLTIPAYHYLGSPCFSPDGEWVAFDAYRSNVGTVRSEVWVSRRDGTEMKMVAVGATPRWSPDSAKLIFMREQRNEIETEPLGIFTIGRNGEGEQFICAGRWPDWSPEGTRLAFSQGAPDPGRGGAQAQSRIFVSQADGAEPALIGEGDCPSWSPDGLRIACCCQGAQDALPSIRVIEVETGEHRFVGYGWYRANWQNDGLTLTCNGMVDRRRTGMFSFTLGSKVTMTRLLPEIAGAMSPCYSADGKFVAFVGR